MSNFIPSYHFAPAKTKLTPKFCKEVINSCFHNSNNISLLSGKNVTEIEQFASGEYDLSVYKKMFKSAKKAIEQNTPSQNVNYTPTEEDLQNMVVPMLPPKLNSAIAIIQKIPTEISVIALDPLAAKKKQEDLTFLKNKPALEADLQEIADRLQVGKVDLGTTKHSSVKFGDEPYGLDLNEPDELQVFIDLLYQLDVEAAFETILQQWNDIKNVAQYRLLETKDQFKFGISSHRAFQNSMTGLPDIEYVYPGNLFTPCSDLPDYCDNTHRYIWGQVTPLQLFNYFSDEIGNDSALDNIVNGTTDGNMGYCTCKAGGGKILPMSNWGTFKMDLLYFEVKSVDSVNVAHKKIGNKSLRYFTDDDDKKEEKNVTGKIWGQNTYCFWWLKNTNHFFGIDRLGFAHRKKGLESYTNFSTNIYKSQERGAVELSIPENKRAQVAYIKMMHALIMAKPDGMVIDLKGVRNAIAGLTEDDEYTKEDLLNMALRDNIIVIDTEGFDGKNDGQLKPHYEIAGGLKSGVQGYLQIITDCNNRIAQYTGINDALTGQSLNPDALVGVEKLRLSNSLNALYYATAAIQAQYQNLFMNWSNVIKKGVEQGGAVKKAIIDFIGADKVSIIDGLEDLPLHTMGVKVTINQREEERAKLDQDIYNLKLKGVISTSDEYVLSVITNPRDKFKYLAVKEKMFMKREDKIRQEQMAAQQEMVAQQGENMVAAKKEESDGEIKLAYAKADAQSKITQLTAQLGLQADQFQALVDRQQNQERSQQQIQKALITQREKANAKSQEALI